MIDKSLVVQPEFEVVSYRGLPAIRVGTSYFAIPSGGEGDDEDGDLPTADPPAVPAVDPRDADIADLRARMNQRDQEFSQLQGSYNVLVSQSQRQGSPAPATETAVTDDDIEAAFEAGDNKRAARLSSKRAEQIAERAVAELKAQHIDPLAGQVTNFGLPAISGQAEELTRLSLTEADRAYYDRYKKEIDHQLGLTNPEFRLVPSNIKAVFAYVKGLHQEEIIAERVEAELRKRAGGGDPMAGKPAATRAKTRDAGTTLVPSPEDLLGPDMARLLEQQGGADRYAQRRGYKDWADRYHKLYGEGGNA